MLRRVPYLQQGETAQVLPRVNLSDAFSFHETRDSDAEMLEMRPLDRAASHLALGARQRREGNDEDARPLSSFADDDGDAAACLAATDDAPKQLL